MSKQKQVKKVFSVRINEDILKKLDNIAKKTSFTRNSLINFILLNALNNKFESIKKIKEI